MPSVLRQRSTREWTTRIKSFITVILSRKISVELMMVKKKKKRSTGDLDIFEWQLSQCKQYCNISDGGQIHHLTFKTHTTLVQQQMLAPYIFNGALSRSESKNQKCRTWSCLSNTRLLFAAVCPLCLCLSLWQSRVSVPLLGQCAIIFTQARQWMLHLSSCPSSSTPSVWQGWEAMPTRRWTVKVSPEWSAAALSVRLYSPSLCPLSAVVMRVTSGQSQR